jgi:hypothetical protein
MMTHDDMVLLKNAITSAAMLGSLTLGLFFLSAIFFIREKLDVLFGSDTKKSEHEKCAKLCEIEAEACINDIVPGDEIGAREAKARAGALLTAAADIRALP